MMNIMIMLEWYLRMPRTFMRTIYNSKKAQLLYYDSKRINSSHMLHGAGIFTYMTGWFLDYMFVNTPYMKHVGLTAGCYSRFLLVWFHGISSRDQGPSDREEPNFHCFPSKHTKPSKQTKYREGTHLKI